MPLLWLVPATASFIPDLCCTDNVFVLSPPHRSENNFDMELELEALLEVCRQSCCTWEALDLFANGFAVINLSCPLWSHPCNLQADGRADEGMPDMALPGNSLALTKEQPGLVPSALETKVQQSAPELNRDAAPAHCIPEPVHLGPVVEVSNISSPLTLPRLFGRMLSESPSVYFQDGPKDPPESAQEAAKDAPAAPEPAAVKAAPSVPAKRRGIAVSKVRQRRILRKSPSIQGVMRERY